MGSVLDYLRAGSSGSKPGITRNGLVTTVTGPGVSYVMGKSVYRGVAAATRDQKRIAGATARTVAAAQRKDRPAKLGRKVAGGVLGKPAAKMKPDLSKLRPSMRPAAQGPVGALLAAGAGVRTPVPPGTTGVMPLLPQSMQTTVAAAAATPAAAPAADPGTPGDPIASLYGGGGGGGGGFWAPDEVEEALTAAEPPEEAPEEAPAEAPAPPPAKSSGLGVGLLVALGVGAFLLLR